MLLQVPARSSGSFDSWQERRERLEGGFVGDRERPAVEEGVEQHGAVTGVERRLGAVDVEHVIGPGPVRPRDDRPDAVRPVGGMVRGRRTTDHSRRTVELDAVGAGGAQPVLGEQRHVHTDVRGTGPLPAREQVVHGRVAETVPLEVVDGAPEEHVVAQRRVDLPQDGRALGVGDAVEVLERRGGVHRAVAGDRMGARPLVGHQPPLAAGVGVVDPDVVVLRHVGGDPVAEVLGERLVEPQVVPPRGRDEVAEPLVGHLVGQRARAGDPQPAGDPAGEDERVAEGDATGVLHRPCVELRDERLVVVAERVADAEEPVQLVEALPGQREQLVGVLVEVGRDARSCAQAERDAVVLVADEVVGAGDDGDEVGREGLALLELPDPGLDLLAGCVADDDPVLRGADVEGVRRLQVGLVEAGEDRRRGVHEGHAVDVVLPVRGVDAAVQPLAVVAERHGRPDHQLVLTLGQLQREPSALEQVDLQGPSVEAQRGDPDRLEIEEGRACPAAEADRGHRPERRVVGSEVERDVVRREVEQVAAGQRLGALE